jgi:hypothetical protein
MGPLNRERIVLIVAVVICLYGIATAFHGEAAREKIADIPGPSGRDKAPMNLISARFLEKPFQEYWGADEGRNPWEPPKTTTRANQWDIRVPEPQLSRRQAVVPPPPIAPMQSVRPVIWQSKPPASLEQAPSAPASEDDEG